MVKVLECFVYVFALVSSTLAGDVENDRIVRQVYNSRPYHHHHQQLQQQQQHRPGPHSTNINNNREEATSYDNLDSSEYADSQMVDYQKDPAPSHPANQHASPPNLQSEISEIFENLLLLQQLQDEQQQQQQQQQQQRKRLAKRRYPSIADFEDPENFGILQSCEVQKGVLSRLRDLVILSIAQVKSCLGQKEPEAKNKYTLVKGENKESSLKNPQDFDTRLLTI